MDKEILIESLGNIFKTTSGGTPSRKKPEFYLGNIPWVKSGELENNIIYGTEEKITEDAIKNSSAKIFPAGTLLIALYGATIGKLAFLGIKATTNQAVCGIFDNGVILSKYTYYFLLFRRPKLIQSGMGGAQPNISQDIVRKQPFPIIPRPEQRAIVSKIEQLFSDLDNGIDNFKKAQEQLKRYRQSVLKAACEGRLVPTEAELARVEGRDYEPADVLLARILKERREKWEDDQIVKFKDKGKIPTNNKWITKFKAPISPNIENLPNLPEGWTWTSPDQISSWDDPYSFAIGPFGSNLKVSDYMSQGVPLVFVRNIRSGIFGDDKTKYVSGVKAKELRPHWISSGDILITKMGDPPGDSYLYPDGLPNAIITADCIKLRLCNLSSNQYFLNAIKSQIVRSQINSITKGVAQKKVSLARIKTIGLPLPPLEEQYRIVTEVERRLSVCDNMEATIAESLQKAESLRQSILKKTFEGKLLNEKELEEARNAPDWEPAEKLLERIKAEKTNIVKNKGKK